MAYLSGLNGFLEPHGHHVSGLHVHDDKWTSKLLSEFENMFRIGVSGWYLARV